MKANNNSVTRDNLVRVLIIQIYKCSSIMARQFMCLALVVIQEEDMTNWVNIDNTPMSKQKTDKLILLM